MNAVTPTTLDPPLPLRLRRAGAALAYILLSVPLGVLSAVVVVLVAIGAVMRLVWAGAPLLPRAVAACRWIAERDRRAANRLLGAHIPPRQRGWEPHWRRGQRLLDPRLDPQLTRMLVLLAVKLPIAVAMLACAAVAVIVTGGLLVLGVSGIAGIGAPTYVGPVRTSVGGGVGLCLLAVPLAVLVVAALGAAGGLLRTLARVLLLAPQTPTGGPVREMLAESLGDRTLSIAYWLPERGIFVDESGREVALPEPGSSRAWTAIERDGQRVAAIVHDAELDTGPELVHAAAAAAELALDNERLKADLRARVEELRVSRARIVEAADAARRRLERDLHDGAQQQLVSLALELRLLKARVREPEAPALVDEVAARLATALAELRELARGIHPAVLTDRGLGAAIQGLADRATVPVDTDVDVGDERPSPAVEAAAYFVVSEALTNVGRYARAGHARVAVRRDADELVVEVEDDGVGGADMSAGSGLRGLTDRLAALDGTVRVESPPGRGTRVAARIPFSAGAPVDAARLADGPAEPRALPPATLEARQ